jgi:hypothetical protein
MPLFHAVQARRVGELTKHIEQLVTPRAGESHEQVLERLREYDVDWYVSERGDLFVRYWQLGAEDFAPAERAAIIRTYQPIPSGADRLEWISANLPALQRDYSGEWIATADGEVVSAPTLQELMVKVEESELDDPFITQIPNAEPTWMTTYADQVV